MITVLQIFKVVNFAKKIRAFQKILYNFFFFFQKAIIGHTYIRVSLKWAQRRKFRICKCIPRTFFRTTMAYSHPKVQPCEITATPADLTTKFLIIGFFTLP